MKIFRIIAFVASAMSFVYCGKSPQDWVRLQMYLQGGWGFRLDPGQEGLMAEWYTADFTETVTLPGTTDTNGKGYQNTKTDETTHLSRKYSYEGKAWYKKTVSIPGQWESKHIRLVLERTKPTVVWVDSVRVVSCDDISTAQIYDLTAYLSAGTHTITVMVDNGESVPHQIITGSHAYSESTQTNWNGIIGRIYLEAADLFHIEDIRVYPDAEMGRALVKVRLSAPSKDGNAQLTLNAASWNSERSHRVGEVICPVNSSDREYEIELPLGEEALRWSELDPALYRLDVSLTDGTVRDTRSVNFGLRDFRAAGTHFTINGTVTFLRGKHDACVFPLSGHTPMEVESWRHYFRQLKRYGINHCRFHSWCPPHACFEAADIEGIYLQPELPFWGTINWQDSALCRFLTKEGVNIQNQYGNHASFVMFALGNELFGSGEVMEAMTNVFRQTDDRHLYAFGSNNFLGYQGMVPGEDFLVTCRIGGEWGANPYNTHVRGSFSFADAPHGGYINHTYPNSVMDFSMAIGQTEVPVIGHETGQFQIYPDFNQIVKYTGVLRPRNLEIFRERLERAGMGSQAQDFFTASGKWAALLYKAEIEMALRTGSLAGFQLLDLQDYPGQGSAYVGILDAFMDSKGLISEAQWREFCSPVVPLFVTEKFCWTSDESLRGEIKIANYSLDSFLGREVRWELRGSDREVISGGSIVIQTEETGLFSAGSIAVPLDGIEKAMKTELSISIDGTEYGNTYPLWIYPADTQICLDDAITVTRDLDTELLRQLETGASVLWIPRKELFSDSTVGGLFQTDYWNYRMFKTISENAGKPVSPGTLGILTDPGHPLFSEFPTDMHTNFQWFNIVSESYPLILDRLPADYFPIVQVIDNVERNHKLGLVFEFAVGKGKILICMSDFFNSMEKPETRQFYRSMVRYMQSADFSPRFSISAASLTELVLPAALTPEVEILENISYYH